jgi:hypothetical protein
MSPTRREFIQRFGIALGAMMAASCVGSRGIGRLLSRDKMPGRGEGTPEERLRNAWQQIGWLEETAKENPDRAHDAVGNAVDEHRAALDALVEDGDLQAGVAEQIHVAFQAAVNHIYARSGLITCYTVTPMSYAEQGARNRLVEQSEQLAQIAQWGSIAPGTLDEIQASIERDMTFLSIPYRDRSAMYQEQFADGGPDLPAVEDYDFEVTPQAAEAATYLVELLSEK